MDPFPCCFRATSGHSASSWQLECPQEFAGVTDTHLKILDLLFAYILSCRNGCRGSWLAALGQSQKAAELPGGHFAVAGPKIGVEDGERPGLSRNQVFKDQRHARFYR